MDKKTAWATLVNPQARIYKSKRLVTEALKISLERKTNGIPLPSVDFPVTLLLVGIYTTLPPKVDRISLNSNVYRNGVFADEYLCFFSRNLTRERERENHSRFEDAIRAALLAVFRFQFRFRLVDSDLVPSRPLNYLKKFHLSQLRVFSTPPLISYPQLSRPIHPSPTPGSTQTLFSPLVSPGISSLSCAVDIFPSVSEPRARPAGPAPRNACIWNDHASRVSAARTGVSEKRNCAKQEDDDDDDYDDDEDDDSRGPLTFEF